MLLIVGLFGLAGCPICPGDSLPIVDGALPVAPGESVQFKMIYGDEEYAHAYACGLHWYVNEVEGGNDQLGTVSGCGRYTAPAVVPDEDVWIVGTVYELYGCADCCPSSSRRISFATSQERAGRRQKQPWPTTTRSTASTRRALR